MNLSTTGLRLAPDAAIDLQLHTTYSDGRWMLEPLLDYLLREQFGLVAITDHDCADTVVTIQQLALDKQLPVLVAIEMTTTWRGKMTDLLCFGFDPTRNTLNDLAKDLLRRQQENTRKSARIYSDRATPSPPTHCRPSWPSPARSNRTH